MIHSNRLGLFNDACLRPPPPQRPVPPLSVQVGSRAE
jgi:alkanesulfonate monooxygenase SsuD/methylene tetrahydromethanopterin reductase-like flavin-dependent oxidoreductase (luciferase family)